LYLAEYPPREHPYLILSNHSQHSRSSKTFTLLSGIRHLRCQTNPYQRKALAAASCTGQEHPAVHIALKPQHFVDPVFAPNKCLPPAGHILRFAQGIELDHRLLRSGQANKLIDYH